ncbi:hypothetical protein EIP91_008704 [Steccherinum ochraceum]|uniref:MYND-type domain-containing protein n=1 Tax=Steccherinum ochraceum TaxID=92696 RepID=A0A4R0R829_9APHY|nr:hypothetical protein EIP91_008704 [Steccherinum ochraceum]
MDAVSSSRTVVSVDVFAVAKRLFSRTPARVPDEVEPLAVVAPPARLDPTLVDFAQVLRDSAKRKERLAARLGPDVLTALRSVRPTLSRREWRELQEMYDLLRPYPALRRYLEWFITLPELFLYCIYVEGRINEIPRELIPDVIWVDELLFEALVEAPPGLLVPLNADRSVPKDLIYQTLFRLVQLMMDRRVGRHLEAMGYLEYYLEDHRRTLVDNGSSHANEPWYDQPHVYAWYAEARVMTNHFDIETKYLLDFVLKAVEERLPIDLADQERLSWTAAKVRACLALVLRELGMEPRRCNRLAGRVAKYLLKRRALKPHFEPLLQHPYQSRHPVTKALGKRWFSDRPYTEHEAERRRRMCAHCGMDEAVADVRLKNCTGCSCVMYCSRSCQRSHWEAHKSFCSAPLDEEGAVLRITGPDNGLLEDHLHRWLCSDLFANKQALIHSLGLQRDAKRCRTHFICRRLEYHPERSDPAQRFITKEWNVFKLEDFVAGFAGGREAGNGDQGVALFTSPLWWYKAAKFETGLMIAGEVTATTVTHPLAAQASSVLPQLYLANEDADGSSSKPRPGDRLTMHTSGDNSERITIEPADIFLQARQFQERLAAGLDPGPYFGDQNPGWVHSYLEHETSRANPAYQAFMQWYFTFPRLFITLQGIEEAADVPTSLMHTAIWMDKTKIRMIEQATDDILPKIGVADSSGREMVIWDLSLRLLFFMMHPGIDRMAEASEHIVHLLEHHKQHLADHHSIHVNEPWRDGCYIELYVCYAISRTVAKCFDLKTKDLLETLAECIETQTTTEKDRYTFASFNGLVVLRCCLVLVLHELKLEVEKQVKLTEWAAKYLRPRRYLRKHLSLETVLKLRCHDQSNHPVTRALGENWFENFEDRPISSREWKIKVKTQCEACGLSEHQLVGPTLKYCMRCRSAAYCSKECQRKHWPSHKLRCKLFANDGDKGGTNVKESENCDDGTLVARVKSWNTARPRSNKQRNLICALGIHRDSSRPDTHVLFEEVGLLFKVSLPPATAPSSPPGDLLQDCTPLVIKCGVYRLDDLFAFITAKTDGDLAERMKKELRTACATRYAYSGADFAETNHSEIDPVYHLLTFTWISCLDFWLTTCEDVRQSHVSSVEYDPRWREKINSSGIPAPGRPTLRGIYDQEFCFTGSK